MKADLHGHNLFLQQRPTVQVVLVCLDDPNKYFINQGLTTDIYYSQLRKLEDQEQGAGRAGVW